MLKHLSRKCLLLNSSPSPYRYVTLEICFEESESWLLRLLSLLLSFGCFASHQDSDDNKNRERFIKRHNLRRRNMKRKLYFGDTFDRKLGNIFCRLMWTSLLLPSTTSSVHVMSTKLALASLHHLISFSISLNDYCNWTLRERPSSFHRRFSPTLLRFAPSPHPRT